MADWFPVGADKIVLALATFLSHYPNNGSRPHVEQAIRAHEFDIARRGGRLAAMAVSRLLGVSAQSRCGLLLTDTQALGSRALLQAGTALPPGLLIVARAEEAAGKLDDAGLARATMMLGERARDA